MSLYHPEKYRIIEGARSGIALCTCWFDPFSVLDKYPTIKELSAITGTLYSKEGVSIMLRNLALNPHIRELVIWGNTPLSNTSFGKAGRDLLVSLWQGSEHTPEIHSEIDRSVLKKITHHVKLTDLSDKTFIQVLEYIEQNQHHPKEDYMPPLSFPDPVRDESKPLPSEMVGWVVRGRTIYQSWLQTLDRVMRYAQVKTTEYGNKQRELQVIDWVIDDENTLNPYMPDLPADVLKKIGLNAESLRQYKTSLIESSVPIGASYTYGARLRAYGPEVFDQIDFIIKKLNEQPNTRRAVATTLMPQHDSLQSSPPCLVLVQAVNNDQGKLNLFATFRSHDIFKAAIPNAYGLLNLQEYICEQTGLKRGVLSVNSISAHVYEEDWDDAGRILLCQKWTDVKTNFNETADLDSRGIVKISILNRELCFELLSFSGEEIYKCCAPTARDLMMKVSKLELLSRPDHYVDLTIEAAKAEIALKAGLRYIQDKQVDVGGVVIM